MTRPGSRVPPVMTTGTTGPTRPADEGAARALAATTSAHLVELEHHRDGMRAAISHEVRTPLAVVRGGLETLAARPDIDPPARVAIEESIDRNLARLQVVLGGMLDPLVLTRVDPDLLERDVQCLVDDALDHAVAVLRLLAGDGRVLTRPLAPPPPPRGGAMRPPPGRPDATASP